MSRHSQAQWADMTRTSCVFAFISARPGNSVCGPHGHQCTEIVLFVASTGTLYQGGLAYDYGDGAILVY